MPLVGAIVCNAHLAEPEIEFEVVHEGPDDTWFTNDGRQVWPFKIHAIEFEHSIPEGWIEHLHQEAARYASKHKAPESKTDTHALLSALGLPMKVHSAVQGKLTRRI